MSEARDEKLKQGAAGVYEGVVRRRRPSPTAVPEPRHELRTGDAICACGERFPAAAAYHAHWLRDHAPAYDAEAGPPSPSRGRLS
jgi:hypothetical protein